MALTVSQIQTAKSDDELFRLLTTELDEVLPRKLRRDRPVFLSKLQSLPRGLRAMATTFDLDVSMALDDLAWHFTNHYDLDLYEETLQGLKELGAVESAELFAQAYAILEPYWNELGAVVNGQEFEERHAWLNQTGIQKSIDPLNDRMWNLIKQMPDHGLMQYWIDYARKFPERCV
jgi:hypothetical protein